MQYRQCDRQGGSAEMPAYAAVSCSGDHTPDTLLGSALGEYTLVLLIVQVFHIY